YQVLRHLKSDPTVRDIPVIVLSALDQIESAVRCIEMGAEDYLIKPFNPVLLRARIGACLEKKRLRDQEVSYLRDVARVTAAAATVETGAFEPKSLTDVAKRTDELGQLARVFQKMAGEVYAREERLKRGVEVLSEETGDRYRLVVGKSASMNQAIDSAKKAAASKATVLLLGESGTGKELFARAIHKWSDRSAEPFVAINCVGLSRELLESDLFGHERGAFTGAHQLKKGKLELADGGTVLLDEVGDIAPEIQTKLLRFLQEREFERVGGLKPLRVDVRIIAATNRDLESAVKEGRFREDLYHRLHVVPITLPSLRNRKEDIPGLIDFFLQRFSLETKKHFTGVTEDAQEKLLAYDWPGNVRELANVMERAIVLGREPRVTLHDLPPRIIAAEPTARSDSFSYREGMNATKRELVLRALAQTRGNRAAAAKLLGLRRTYLLKLIKALGID
ncbi:MAG: sigma-54-dependent Fis family transcriptional regulator, partial [Deltaproteobacteria bacterium]|nr:sigma-54-dependent Fis family transcriptional regulator [Deltaproteobacteria bacterium]